MLLKAVEWSAVVGTMSGLFLLSEGIGLGFFIGLVSNILWIYYGHETNSNGIMLVNACLMLININGIG
jgi:hypothetical protein